MSPRVYHNFIRLGPALPTPPSLSSLLPAPAWVLFLVGYQCDNTRSKLQIIKLTSLSLVSS